MFLRTEITVVLSINILMDTLENSLTKEFQANFTANISFMFMWYVTSLTDQLPPVFWSLILDPQPKLDASKVTVGGSWFIFLYKFGKSSFHQVSSDRDSFVIFT